MNEDGTTLVFPTDLPVVRRGDHWLARAGDIDLRLTSLVEHPGRPLDAAMKTLGLN